MNDHTVEDLILIDDLAARDDSMAGVADVVRGWSHEQIETMRDALLCGLGRYAETSVAAADPTKRRHFALSDRLEALGCKELSNEFREILAREKGDEDAACLVMGVLELLDKVSTSAQLLADLVLAFTEVNRENLVECEADSELWLARHTDENGEFVQ